MLIVAAGGVPTKPDVPGYELKNVVKTADLYELLKFMIRLVGPQMLRKLTTIWMPVGKKVVIVGGAIQGCQLSEFLIKRGRNVTIVEEGEELGEWLVPERKTRLFYWFDKKGIERLTGVKLVKFTKEGVTIETKEGKTRLLEADTIIPVLPFSPNKELAEKAQGQGGRGLHHRRLRQPGRHPRRDQGRLEDRQRAVDPACRHFRGWSLGAGTETRESRPSALGDAGCVPGRQPLLRLQLCLECAAGADDGRVRMDLLPGLALVHGTLVHGGGKHDTRGQGPRLCAAADPRPDRRGDIRGRHRLHRICALPR